MGRAALVARENPQAEIQVLPLAVGQGCADMGRARGHGGTPMPLGPPSVRVGARSCQEVEDLCRGSTADPYPLAFAT